MKKTIRPSPLMLLLNGGITAFLAFIIITDTSTGGEPVFEEVLVCIVTGLMFIYYLIRYILRGKVHFDDEAFTVHGKTYSFSCITRAVVSNQTVGISPSIGWILCLFGRARRLFSTHTEQKIEIYAKGVYVFSFTRDEPGSEDFIDVLKKHRVRFTVRNSLSDWEGEIE